VSVFVTVGTDHHPFDRMTRWVDGWLSRRAEPRPEVFVQYGTSAPPAVAPGDRYVEHQEMERRMASASAIVCHGGPGTITDCLRAGVKPIVVPRRHGLGEHVDDHQVRFSRRLAEAGYIEVADSEDELGELIDRALAGDPTFRAEATEDQVRATTARFASVVSELLEPAPDLRVLYVGGWGRSGSTLLDRLLGQVPGMFSVGEMRDIWLRGVLEDRRCGCGEPFSRCPFWTEVGAKAFGGWSTDEARDLHELRTRYDRPWMTPLLAARRVRTPGLDRYVETTGRLYAAIREVSGAGVIVDSTKIPSYALLLGRIARIELRFVHLVRDPRGVVHSWRKSVERPDATGTPDRMIRYGAASGALRYVLYNSMAGLMRRTRSPYLFVRYEDLVRDVPEKLERILQFEGLDGVPLTFVDGGRVRLEANHSVDGNPMRFRTGEIEIRADEEWRSSMAESDRRLVGAMTGRLLRRYGYR
jgi:UDP-N-acetylglucosamine transferase subunit ALG13